MKNAVRQNTLSPPRSLKGKYIYKILEKRIGAAGLRLAAPYVLQCVPLWLKVQTELLRHRLLAASDGLRAVFIFCRQIDAARVNAALQGTSAVRTHPEAANTFQRRRKKQHDDLNYKARIYIRKT